MTNDTCTEMKIATTLKLEERNPVEQELHVQTSPVNDSNSERLTKGKKAQNEVRFAVQPVTGSVTQETIAMADSSAVDVNSTSVTNDSNKRGNVCLSTPDATSSCATATTSQHTTR